MDVACGPEVKTQCWGRRGRQAVQVGRGSLRPSGVPGTTVVGVGGSPGGQRRTGTVTMSRAMALLSSAQFSKFVPPADSGRETQLHGEPAM